MVLRFVYVCDWSMRMRRMKVVDVSKKLNLEDKITSDKTSLSFTT